MEELAPEGIESSFSETQKSTWENDKDEFLKYRREVCSAVNAAMSMFYRDSDAQRGAFEYCSKIMRERLGYDESLIKKLGTCRASSWCVPLELTSVIQSLSLKSAVDDQHL